MHRILIRMWRNTVNSVELWCLQVVHFPLYTLLYTLMSTGCTLSIVHFVVHFDVYRLYTFHCTLCCTLWCLQVVHFPCLQVVHFDVYRLYTFHRFHLSFRYSLLQIVFAPVFVLLNNYELWQKLFYCDLVYLNYACNFFRPVFAI